MQTCIAKGFGALSRNCILDRDVEDCLDFLRINFNAAMRHDEAKELSCRHTKDAFAGVEHHVELPKVVEGFLQVGD